MSEKMLPCPFCGKCPFESLGEGGQAEWACPDCSDFKTWEEWQTRAQPKWQNEPTEDGWYWVYDPEEKWRSSLCWIEKLISISYRRPVKSGEPVCWWIREAVHGDSGEWQPRMRCCGPLQMPKEPEVKDE